MTRKPRGPVIDAPPRLRQRQRVDGSWRVWWEPRHGERALGFLPVELSADKPGWSMREAQRLNAEVAQAQLQGRRSTGRPTGRAISDLIGLYRQSVHFRETLSAKTRTSYTALLNQIEDKWGTRRVVDFDKEVMATWYQTLYYAKGPRMGQALIRMMSVLFAFAETHGWRPDNSNPCFRLQVKTPQPRARVVSWAEFDALTDAARRIGLPSVALAMQLSLFQGQRQTDVLAATRSAFALMPVLRRGHKRAVQVWVWTFVRSKRQNHGQIELHPEVIPALRAVLADTGTPDDPRQPGDRLLRCDRTGKPFTEDLFAKRFAEVRAAAAGEIASVAGIQFRDLRRSFGSLSRAGGASKDDTADVLGNSAAVNPQLGETYMAPTFHTASRAVAAIRRPTEKTSRKGQ
jgi:integrase